MLVSIVAKRVVAVSMFSCGAIFALLAVVSLFLPADPNAKDQASNLLIRWVGAIFLLLLASIAFISASRLFSGRRNKAGMYFPPWAFSFIGLITLGAGIGDIVVNQNWVLVQPTITASLLLFGASIAAYRTRQKQLRRGIVIPSDNRE